ncbi:MAG: AI-2E family transporter [Pseudomonadota bacterium]
MNVTENFSPIARFVLISAATVIVVAGIKSASTILAPVLMAVFISIVCSAPLFALQRRGIPNWVALGIILGIVGLAGLAIFSLMASSVDEFSRSLPRYRLNLTQLYNQMTARLGDWGVTLPMQGIQEQLQPDSFITMLNYMLNGLSNILADGLVVFLAVFFILTDVAGLPEKLNAILRNPEESVGRLSVFIEKVIHYLALKAATSALTGVCVALILWVLDIDYVFLWAILAFFLNFIPYVGSILAGLPPVLLAMVDHGWVTAVWAISGYVAINIIVGNIIETRWMGDGLNLSSFVVFVSLIFWGWVLGPAGMFLSIPLTMLIVIALESSPDSQVIARLMQNRH